MRRAAGIVAALSLALAFAAAPAGAVTQRTSLVTIEQQVMCVTCGIPLVEADSVAAQREKAFIQRLVDRGDSAGEIRAQLVAQYGVAVLALPPDHGFNVVFYVAPVAAVLLALAVVALLLPRWRRNRRASPAAGGAALSAADSARLDADLARFDD